MNKKVLENAFSGKRLEKYFNKYSDDDKAIMHYQCNIELSEAFYPSIAVLEVLLRNTVSKELTKLFGREDWYTVFATTPGLIDLNKYITQANRQTNSQSKRNGNTVENYCRTDFGLLDKFVQCCIFHHEPICWNFERLQQIHAEILKVIEWINKDISVWLASFDRFNDVCINVEKRL